MHLWWYTYPCMIYSIQINILLIWGCWGSNRGWARHWFDFVLNVVFLQMWSTILHFAIWSALFKPIPGQSYQIGNLYESEESDREAWHAFPKRLASSPADRVWRKHRKVHIAHRTVHLILMRCAAHRRLRAPKWPHPSLSLVFSEQSRDSDNLVAVLRRTWPARVPKTIHIITFINFCQNKSQEFYTTVFDQLFVPTIAFLGQNYEDAVPFLKARAFAYRK